MSDSFVGEGKFRVSSPNANNLSFRLKGHNNAAIFWSKRAPRLAFEDRRVVRSDSALWLKVLRSAHMGLEKTLF